MTLCWWFLLFPLFSVSAGPKERLRRKLTEAMEEKAGPSPAPHGPSNDPPLETFPLGQLLKGFLREDLFSPPCVSIFLLSWQMLEQRLRSYVCQPEGLSLAFFLPATNIFHFLNLVILSLMRSLCTKCNHLYSASMYVVSLSLKANIQSRHSFFFIIFIWQCGTRGSKGVAINKITLLVPGRRRGSLPRSHLDLFR